MVASLIRHDKLDRKAGWDVAWLLEESSYPVKKVPVAATADTLVGATSGSIVAGGVMFRPGQVVGEGPREGDDGGTLEQSRRQVRKLRKENGDGAVVGAK